MSSMFVTEPAVLLVLHTTGLLLLVLRCCVVATLAVCTLQSNNVSHGMTPLLGSYVELATGIEPVTSSLPRKCSTN